ncbi:helix-turn-helix transcriptional regulator [Bradyrhizobium sp. WSM2254]|uniref:helix-turn-helix transcriptional regulator n=1 Tax=Bradyrhizobium sp. WSM2254 TaxID=1188263 RepID=UPI0018DCAE3D|nr:helix-turn-helix transcriptional regulator [Bradyrhizobium sp. WSM2254]
MEKNYRPVERISARPSDCDPMTGWLLGRLNLDTCIFSGKVPPQAHTFAFKLNLVYISSEKDSLKHLELGRQGGKMKQQPQGSLVPLGECAALTKAIGTPSFGEASLRFLAQSVLVDTVILFEMRSGKVERTAFASMRSTKKVDRTSSLYAAHFSHLDPNASLVRSMNDHGVIASRLRECDVQDSGYRNVCYLQSGVVDRFSIISGSFENWWALNLYREKASGRFSDDEIGRLTTLCEFAGAAASRHIVIHRHCQPVPIRDYLDRALEDRTDLTRRERHVCREIAKGKTAQEIADDLAIGVTSVITFRRRAYLKLGINKHHQLLELCKSLAN